MTPWPIEKKDKVKDERIKGKGLIFFAPCTLILQPYALY